MVEGAEFDIQDTASALGRGISMIPQELSPVLEYDGGPLPVTADEAIETLAVLDAARTSAAQGRFIPLS